MSICNGAGYCFCASLLDLCVDAHAVASALMLNAARTKGVIVNSQATTPILLCSFVPACLGTAQA